jgi:NAD-dependent dihydropyrimidine dehydrogenase PreA subunit
VKTRLISIDGNQIGIAGLEEALEELHNAGRKPDAGLGDHLLGRLKKMNYIPPAKEEAYAAAFIKAYRRYSDRKAGKTEPGEKGKGTWEGIPREEIPWFPNILDDLCDGCQICLKFCAFGVYEYDEKTNKVKVVNPFNCVVGCSGCAPQCKPKAIVFPPLQILETFKKK